MPPRTSTRGLLGWLLPYLLQVSLFELVLVALVYAGYNVIQSDSLPTQVAIAQSLNSYFLTAALTVPIGVFLGVFAAAIAAVHLQQDYESNWPGSTSPQLRRIRTLSLLSAGTAGITVELGLIAEVILAINVQTQSEGFVRQSVSTDGILGAVILFQILTIVNLLNAFLLVRTESPPPEAAGDD